MSEKPTPKPYVRFETRAVEDRNQLISEGHYGFKDQVIAHITIAGQRDTVERVAEDWLKDLRKKAQDGFVPTDWPDHFQRIYDAYLRSEEVPEEGTPIKGWALLTPAQQKVLLGAGIMTVETLASLNEEALQRIGMGGRVWKQTAASWLADSDKNANAAKIATLTRDNEDLRNKLQAVLAEVEVLKQQRS